jgi:hypothetical protein
MPAVSYFLSEQTRHCTSLAILQTSINLIMDVALAGTPISDSTVMEYSMDPFSDASEHPPSPEASSYMFYLIANRFTGVRHNVIKLRLRVGGARIINPGKVKRRESGGWLVYVLGPCN